MSERKTIPIVNQNLISKIVGRTAIALDTSVWFNLAEYDNGQVEKVRNLLLSLVQQGKVFCPLTFSNASELLRRHPENAIRVAGVMDDLSLGITFVQNSEIFYREIEMFLSSALKNSEFKVERNQLFGPPLSWLAGNLHIDFPDGFPADAQQLQNFVDQSAQHINSLTVTGMITMLSSLMPLPQIIEKPNYDWKKRWEENNGNKNKLKQIEKQNIVQRIVDEILRETDLENPLHSLSFKQTVLNYINSLPKDDDGTSANAILERMPAHKNMMEVMTFAGFDPQRIDKMNDFYDLDFLVIPAAYADVFVATDKWIRSLMKSYGKTLHSTSANYIASWNEFENYLEQI